MSALSRRERQVLAAIKEAQPLAYGNSIYAIVSRDRRPNRLTAVLGMIFDPGPAMIYPPLVRLEKDGYVTSEWSQETFPERGNRRRRYYFLTEKGRSALATHAWIQDATTREANRLAEETAAKKPKTTMFASLSEALRKK